MNSRLAWSREAWPFVWPALPPLIMVTIGTSVFWFFTQTPAGITPPVWPPHLPDTREAVAGELAVAKASAYATSIVLLFACLVCILLCRLIIARHLLRRRFTAEAAIWGVIVLVGCLVFRLPQTQALDFFGKCLFANTVVPIAGSLRKVSVFDLMFQGVTAIALVAGSYVVGAICVTLGATARASPAGFAAKVRFDLKYLLFAASSVFVLGVVCAHAFSGWAGSFYGANEASAHKQFLLALQAYITLQATVYFLILAAMFAPVAYVALRRRWRMWHSIRTGPAVWSEIVQHLVAVAAPLIAAPLLALIGAPPMAG